MPRLIIESGTAAQDVALADICRIGRDPGNDLVLDDAGASRRHCEIRKDGDQWLVQDLKSANGTFKNDERVLMAPLVDGDRIRVGGVVMRFATADAAPGSAAGAAAGGAAAGASVPPRYALVFTSGEHAGKRVPVASSRTTIGRKAGNAVVVKDPKVSGVHAEVALDDGHPVLRDLGSTNGTFLEGKKVDDVPLTHGERVLVGDNEFVFVDTTLPEPPALRPAVVGDGSQTIADVPQVKVVKAQAGGRSPWAMLGLLLLLGCLGGAGWFYWSVRGQSSAPVAPPPAANNLLGARWSLENADGADDPGQAFDLAAGSPAGFRVETGRAHSGSQCLAASPGDGSAVAALRQPLVVTPGREIVAGAWIAAADDTYGMLCATFQRADDPSFSVPVCIGAASGGGWTHVTDTVVPPSGADRLVLELVAAGGGGEVRFDDLSVAEGGVAKPDVASVNGFEFETVDHALLVHRGGAGLLRVLGPRFVAADGAAHDVPRYLAAVANRDAGRVLLPGGGTLDFSSALDRNGELPALRIEWNGAGAAALAEVQVPLVLLPRLAEEPVGVFRGGVLEPFRDAFEAEAVEGLVLGRGLTRMRLTFEPPVAVRGTRGAAAFDLVLRVPPSAGRLLARMQVDFVAEKANAKELLGKAAAAEGEKRLGEALAMLARIGNEFPFDEAVLKEADEGRQRILRQRESLEQRVAQAAARARFLASAGAYEEAQTEAETAARQFAGTDAAKGFTDRRNELAAEREKLLRSAGEREAELLLARLETALAQEPPRARVAKQIADYLAQRYPWSEAARQAATKVGD